MSSVHSPVYVGSVRLPADRIPMEVVMRWPIRLSVAVIILLMAYAAWPLLGLKRIADAVDTRNSAAFVELLDVPELKRSLAAQLVRAYLKVTGKDQRLSPIALNLAVQAGIGVADSIVVEITNAEALIDLLQQARIETFAENSISGQAWGLPNLRNARGLFLGSEYRGNNFYVTIPLSAEAKEGYRLRLKLSQWKWKLAGIDLPEELQLRLAREIVKRSAP